MCLQRPNPKEKLFARRQDIGTLRHCDSTLLLAMRLCVIYAETGTRFACGGLSRSLGTEETTGNCLGEALVGAAFGSEGHERGDKGTDVGR